MLKYINLVKNFRMELRDIEIDNMTFNEKIVYMDLKENLKNFQDVLELRYWTDGRKFKK